MLDVDVADEAADEDLWADPDTTEPDDTEKGDEDGAGAGRDL